MYQVGAACYHTAQAALSAIASAQVGNVVADGGTARVVGVDSVTETGIVYTLTTINGGSVSTLSVPLTLQPCGLYTAADAVSLGWLVALAWIAIYALLFITRALRGETTSNYGNA